MSDEQPVRGLDGTWDGLLEHWIDHGFADDEIEDAIDQTSDWFADGKPLGGTNMPTRAGDRFHWGTKHGRRRVLALLATIRGPEQSTADGDRRTAVPDATPANVRAELERRQAANEASGYGALAAHFMVGRTTIRRRLGRDSGWSKKK